MVKVKQDLTGMTFGRLTVLRQAEDHVQPNGRHYAQWWCQCSCGSEAFVVCHYSLTKKNGTTHCGCLQKEMQSRRMKRYNTYDLDSQDFGIGYTSKNEEFWFDKEDYELIKDYCWSYTKKGYLVSKDINSNDVIYFHRLVMNVQDKNAIIDHRRHPPRNGLKHDNRKENLKIATASQNGMNMALNKNNSSGITGISYNKRSSKWEAYITINTKRKHLGLYKDINDAIRARKSAEIEYFQDNRYDMYN